MKKNFWNWEVSLTGEVTIPVMRNIVVKGGGATCLTLPDYKTSDPRPPLFPPPVQLWPPRWGHRPAWLSLSLQQPCWVGNITGIYNIQAAVKCIFIAKYPRKSEESWNFLFWSNNKWISNHLFKLSVVAREFFLCEISDKWHCSNLNFYLFSSARAPN